MIPTRKPKSKSKLLNRKGSCHSRKSTSGDQKTYSCELCENVDSDDMVQCDTCDFWYHFVCAGVTSDISKKDWNCVRCNLKLIQNAASRNENIQKSISVRSTTSSSRHRALALQRLEEERNLKEKRDNEYLSKKYSILEHSDDELVEGQTDGRVSPASMENTLRWAMDVQKLSKSLGRVCMEENNQENLSISINDDERTMIDQMNETIQHPLLVDMNSQQKTSQITTNIQQDFNPIKSSNVQPQPTNDEFKNYSRNLSMNDQVQSNIRNTGHNLLPGSMSMVNPVHSNSVNVGFQSTPMQTSNLESSKLDFRAKSKIVSANFVRFGDQPPKQQVLNPHLNQIATNIINGQQQNQKFDQFGAIPMEVRNNQQSKIGAIGVPSTPFVQMPKLNPAVDISNVPNVQESQCSLAQSCVGATNIQQPHFNYGQATNVPQLQSKFGYSNTANVQFNSTNAPGNFPFQSTNVPYSTNLQTSASNLGFPYMNIQSNQLTQPNTSNFGFQSTNAQSMQPNISYFGSNPSNFPVNQNNLNYQSSTAPNIHMAPLNVSSNILNSGHLLDYSQLCLPNVTLTPSQISARHTMEKKLPRFFGEPKKWQIFESAFVTATVNCGLNNSENLPRLQDCLKGDALEAVQCQLLHPQSVPGVMNTLRMMYGRPEMIINKLLEDAKQTISPKADDLVSLVKFAVAVQNLCATVVYFNATEHLRNPMLIKTLTDKLPAQIQLNWAFYKQSVGDANLSTLGNWLYQLANVVTDVVEMPANHSNIKKAKKEYEKSKSSNSGNYINATRTDNVDRRKSSTFVNAHLSSQDVKSKASSTKKLSKCKACDSDSCKTLASCKKFKQLSPEDRWDFIKKNKICGSCFGNHAFFRCVSKKICGIDGCNRKHHELLHNPLFNQVSDLVEMQNHGNSHRLTSSSRKFPDIFRIVPVLLSYMGKSISIFAYLDDGSNLTSLEESVAKQLGAYGTKQKLYVLWSFGESQLEPDSRRLSIKICGVQNDAEEYSMDHVRTVKKLVLPTQSITLKWIAQYSYMKNIPITPYNNATPQMIIGLEYSKLMVSLETIEGEWTQPIVCRTRLGWVVQGPNDHSMDNVFTRYSLNMCECEKSNDDLHQLVQQFFSIENFGVKISEKLLESKAKRQ